MASRKKEPSKRRGATSVCCPLLIKSCRARKLYRYRASQMWNDPMSEQIVMSSLIKDWSSCTSRRGWIGTPFVAAACSANCFRSRAISPRSVASADGLVKQFNLETLTEEFLALELAD